MNRRDTKANNMQYTQLFIRAIEKLSNANDIYSPIGQIMQEICRFFRFGSGFIYQMDHTGTLHLKEFHSEYKDQVVVKPEIRLAEILTPEEQVIFKESHLLKNIGDTKGSALEAHIKDFMGVTLFMLVPFRDSDGELMGLVGVSDRRSQTMLTEDDLDVANATLSLVANQMKAHMYQERVATSTKALQSVLDNLGVDVYVNDFNTHEILYVNESMARPYGGFDNMMGKECWRALYDDKEGQCDFCPQKKLTDEDGNPTKIYSWDYQRPFDGSWFRVLSAAFPWVDGRLAHVVSSVDITENKQNEEIIRRMAEYDTLTGLPNRRKLVNLLESGREQMLEEGNTGYIIFFDLDNFKQVNDTYGHRAGDELLTRVGQILESSPITQGHGYRHGGDEFVLRYKSLTDEGLAEVIRFLLENLNKPQKLEDGDVYAPISIGIASFPNDGKNAEEVIHAADMAMYASKEAGKGVASIYNGGDIELYNL